ncbi:hypothetical protein H4R34_000656 [Dimargaris verticillata]|uniref:GATA-type domain-containing protein n=1 Tax=Dimargaris verticillata TaxID=2761393 RepID=A0A9W8B5V9_9FUNG|nr:hypothetical protein H4R34_000656 [Dimargaris verticillata]
MHPVHTGADGVRSDPNTRRPPSTQALAATIRHLSQSPAPKSCSPISPVSPSCTYTGCSPIAALNDYATKDPSGPILPPVSTLSLAPEAYHRPGALHTPLPSPAINLDLLASANPLTPAPDASFTVLPCFWAVLASPALTIVHIPRSVSQPSGPGLFPTPYQVSASLLDCMHPEEAELARQDVLDLFQQQTFHGTEITCRLRARPSHGPGPVQPDLSRRSSASRLPDPSLKPPTPLTSSARASSVEPQPGLSRKIITSPYVVVRLGLYVVSDELAVAFVHPKGDGWSGGPCACAHSGPTAQDLMDLTADLSRYRTEQLYVVKKRKRLADDNNPTTTRLLHIFDRRDLKAVQCILPTALAGLKPSHPLCNWHNPDFVAQLYDAESLASLRREIRSNATKAADPLACTLLPVRWCLPYHSPVTLDALVVYHGALVFVLLQTRDQLPANLGPNEPPAPMTTRMTQPTIGSTATLLTRSFDFGSLNDLRRHSIDVSPSGMGPPVVPPPRRLSLNPTQLNSAPAWSPLHSPAATSLVTVPDGRAPKNRRIAELAYEAKGYDRLPDGSPSPLHSSEDRMLVPTPHSQLLPSAGTMPSSASTKPGPTPHGSSGFPEDYWQAAARRASAGILPPANDNPKLRRFSFPFHGRPTNTTTAYVEPPAETSALPPPPPPMPAYYRSAEPVYSVKPTTHVYRAPMTTPNLPDLHRPVLPTIPEGSVQNREHRPPPLALPPSPGLPTFPMTSPVYSPRSHPYPMSPHRPTIGFGDRNGKDPASLHRGPADAAPVGPGYTYLSMRPPTKRNGPEYTLPSPGLRTTAIQQPKQCESCKTDSSPEWRRGPSGHKTLCNACGLRYSRSLLREKKGLVRRNGGTTVEKGARSSAKTPVSSLTRLNNSVYGPPSSASYPTSSSQPRVTPSAASPGPRSVNQPYPNVYASCPNLPMASHQAAPAKPADR